MSINQEQKRLKNEAEKEFRGFISTLTFPEDHKSVLDKVFAYWAFIEARNKHLENMKEEYQVVAGAVSMIMRDVEDRFGHRGD